MINPLYKQANFLLSAQHPRQFPEDVGCEIAFAGRSNSGKSSALNALSNIKSLARVSKTPGRTQLLNFFQLDANARIVDLPGYGYAKVKISVKKQWEALIIRYFRERKSLVGVVLLMDSRHPMKPMDCEFLDWCQAVGLATHILLSKSDKLSFSAAKSCLNNVSSQMPKKNTSVQLFSSTKKKGLEELSEILDDWLTIP